MKQVGAKPFALLVAAVLAGCIAGCRRGPELGDVTGKVTYNGQPVVGATIYFIPIGEGKQSIGYSDENGEYELQYTLQWSGALVGKHRVTIQIFPREGIKPVPVPEKFGRKSEVEFDVQPGNNEFDIDLSS